MKHAGLGVNSSIAGWRTKGNDNTADPLASSYGDIHKVIVRGGNKGRAWHTENGTISQ